MAIPKVAGTDLYTDVARVINEDATEMGFSYRKTQGKQIKTLGRVSKAGVCW